MSVHQPHSRTFETQSPALAFLAVVLALLGITDLTTLSLPDEICLVHYWGMQAPLRLTLTFFLAIYSFFFSSSSPFFYAEEFTNSSSTSPGRAAGGMAHHSRVHTPGGGGGVYVPSGWGGDALKNRVFFTFVFVETMSWFWVWVTLQEERQALLARKAKRRSGSYGREH